MALTLAEEKEMKALEAELNAPKKSKLTPAEAAEMQALEAELGFESFGDRLSGLFSSSGRQKLRDKVAAVTPAPKPKTETDVEQTTVEHFANGALLGYLPQVQAAAQKPMFSALNAMTGQNVEPDSYVDARDKTVRRLAAQAEQNPNAAAGAGLGGLVAGSFVVPAPMPKALQGAGKGLVGLGKAAGRGAVYGAEYGAVANPGDVQGEVSPVQLGERIGKSLDGAEAGAKFGGGLNLLAKTGGAVPGVAKKAMTVFLGPSKETINYYLKNHKAVNQAKSVEELKDHVDTIVTSLRDQVEKGKLSVADAKEGLRQIEQKISEHKRESGFQYQVTKTEVNQALRDARAALNEALGQKTQALRDVKAPIEMADEVVAAGKDLRDKNVVRGSADAQAHLSADDVVQVQPLYKELKTIHDSLNVAGVAPATAEVAGSQKSIAGLRDMLGKLPTTLTPQETKQLIMQLDASERAIYNTPGFTGDVAKAYKSLRQGLDAQLKRNTKYAAAMKPVAEARQLMDMIPRDRSEAISLLNRIASPTTTVEREALAKLGKLTGRDFESGVKRYLEAQGKLKDPHFMRQLEESLPEHARVQESTKAARLLEGPEAQREFTQRRLNESGLLREREAAEGLLSREQQGLLQRESAIEPFKGVTEGSSENKIKGLLNAKPGEQVELRKQFAELTKLSDIDFEKAVADLANKRAFSSDATRGSRNVNMFAALGGTVGAGAGGMLGAPATGAAVGAASGAALGATVDKYGPAMAKRILDGVIKMGENPSVLAIRRLNISDEAKNDLLRQLVQFKETRPTQGLLKSAGQPEPQTVTEGYEQ